MSQAIFSPVPTIRHAVPAPFSARLLRDAAAAFAGLAREWRLRSARRSLEALDARALADIGIGPGQAEGAVRFGRSRLGRVRPLAPSPKVPQVMPASWTEWR